VGQAPKGYVPGLGRGAAGFVTRSDVGPASRPAPSSDAAAGDASAPSLDAVGGSGSRASELRAAKLAMQKMQKAQQHVATPFGQAPQGYVAGAGRGASVGKADDGPTGGEGMEGSLFSGADQNFDDDDDEADRIYDAIDERMNSKRRKHNDDGASAATGSAIGDQFRELKQKLADVTEDQWAAIPDVGDYSLRHKQKRREDVFTPLTDSLLESRSKVNSDATAGGKNAMAGTTQVLDGTATYTAGYRTNLSGLAEARSTVMTMSLDKMSDSVSGQTVIDPKGYLTSLSNTKIASAAEVGDVNKARLLLKSVRDTNPKHGPGWIAAARVEEAAGKTVQARKLIMEGCETCPDSEDVWLEAARLHPQDQAKTILAAAARRLPTSVKVFLRAADLEAHDSSKKAVLRKALEANPTSVTLWKAAVDLEDADDARILLSVAVEKVPHSVEMWLALARLESYENARKVLNQARKQLPTERAVWIAAAKLEESQNHGDMVDRIVDKAVRSLDKHEAVVTRAQWLKEAEAAEAAGAPLTSAAIVKCTVGRGVDDEDRQRTWADDANAALSRNAVATARAILAHSLAAFPTKRGLWLQAVDLERKHGTASSLDEVLAAASERLPRTEIFWLVRAKEKWLAGDVDSSRNILTEAFKANPDSEPVWLAAVKLEWETGEIERAQKLLERARERAPTARIFMKSALLERECGNFDGALDLLEQGILRYPTFAKMYMMGGQICSEDLKKDRESLDRARKFYQRGLQNCPKSVVLWCLASRLEEKVADYGAGSASAGVTKARSLLELARLKNPKNAELWVEAIRLERRAGNDKLAVSLMARALQECPSSGLLLAENISTSPRVEQKSKSADAIKRCPDDPRVITAVADLFAGERKHDKARKWFERAVILDPDMGDSWAKFYAFEQDAGTKEARENVKQRCIAAEPKHGELWCQVAKAMPNRRKTTAEHLEAVAHGILEKMQQFN
jgi:pre-mRNA-processing factor 6